MDEKYRGENFKSGSEQLIEFESEEIKLDIPLEGTTLKEGWKISPLTDPEVRALGFCLTLQQYNH